MKDKKLILWFKDINSNDVSLVGGKNASLGEMFSKLAKKGIHPVKSRKAGILPKAELFNRVKVRSITTKKINYCI